MKLEGIIKDSKTKDPISFATIYFSDSKKGIIADENGKFSLDELCAGVYHIDFRMLGYKTQHQEIWIKEKKASIQIWLEEEIKQMQEVEIVGSQDTEERAIQSLLTETVNTTYLLRNDGGTLMNSLEKKAGIRAINTGTGISKPVIRGMSMSRVIVNDAGIKQEDQQWGADHGLQIDQYGVGGAEIVKGASALLYGSDGIGGVINVLPPAIPQLNRLKSSLMTTFRSNNNYWGVSGMVEGNKNGKIVRMRLSGVDYADYQCPADSFIYNSYILPIHNGKLKNTAGSENSVSLMIGIHKPKEILTLTISNYYQQAGFFVGATGKPRAYQLTHDGNYRNVELPRQLNNHFKTIINHKRNFKNGFWETDLGYQYNHRKEESKPHAHGQGEKNTWGNLAIGLDLQTITLNSRFQHKAAVRTENMYGINLQYQENKKTGFEFLIPDYKAFTVGTFIYSQIKFSEKLNTNLGLRFDFATQNAEAYRLPVYNDSGQVVKYNERSPDLNRYYANFSAACGLSYFFIPKLNLKLNAGSSYRIPSIAELLSNGVHHGTFRHELGTSTLQSERGIQIDISLLYTSSKVNIQASTFYNYFSNFIYLRPSGLYSSLPEAGQIYQYSQAEALNSGFELSFSYKILKNLQWSSALEYVRNQNLETMLPLPFTPPFSTWGEVEYTIPKVGKTIQQWYFSMNTRYFAAQNRTDRNEKKTPAYTVLELATGMNILIGKQRSELSFRITNLGNVRYLNHMSRYRILNLPEQGRNFVVSWRVFFG